MHSQCLDEHDWYEDGWTDGERCLGRRRQVMRCAHCGITAVGKRLPDDHPYFNNSLNENLLQLWERAGHKLAWYDEATICCANCKELMTYPPKGCPYADETEKSNDSNDEEVK